MADWQDLHYFLALAESGSLSGAARVAGVEHATISRRVAALEKQMGLKLIDRRGRRISLTTDGERIAGIASRMASEAEAIQRVMAVSGGLEAEVTISAPPSYANFVLASPLAQLSKTHPGLRLRMLGETRYVSLDRREADIAIRLGRPEKGDFAIRKIDEIGMRFFASPDYLAATPESEWRFIAYDEAMDEAPQQRWLHEKAGVRQVAVRATSLEMQREFARFGCGLAVLPEFMVDASSGLVPAEPDQPAFRREVWLAVHTDMKDAPAIRTVIDALAGHGRSGIDQ